MHVVIGRMLSFVLLAMHVRKHESTHTGDMGEYDMHERHG